MLLIAVMLIGCNGEAITSTVAPSPTVKTSAQPTEIKVWATLQGAKGLEAVLPSFSRANPNIKVNLTAFSQEEIHEKLDAGLLAGGVGLPDVVQVENERFEYFITKFPEGFADLKNWANRYREQFDASKWQLVQRIGRIRGLPWNSGPVGLFYRIDLFQQAGINPASIETWDDFIQAGERLKKINPATKLLTLNADSDSLFRSMLTQQGVNYFTYDGKISLNAPEAIRALTLIRRMYNAGLLQIVNGEEKVIPALIQNQATAYVAPADWAGTLPEIAPQLAGKWEVMALPAIRAGGGRSANLGGSMLAVLRTGKNQEAAASLVEYALTNPEMQNTMLKTAALLPSFLPAQNADFYNSPQPYFNNKPIWQFFAREINQLKPFYYTKDYNLAADAAANAQLMAIFRTDPEQALLKKANDLKELTAREVVKPLVEARK